jgi:uncharacterized delta-60 repeat protein
MPAPRAATSLLSMQGHSSHRLHPLERRTFLSAGQLDKSFGGTGTVITDLPPQQIDYEGPIAVLPRADGKVITVANAIAQPLTNAQPHRAILVRYNADGSLDDTFDQDGIEITAVPGWDSTWPLAATLLGDNTILVWMRIERNYDSSKPDQVTSATAMIHYSADGQPDFTSPLDQHLGGEGRVFLALPNGKTLVAGNDFNNTQYDNTDDFFFLARLNVDGSVDITFGNNGRVLLGENPAIGSITDIDVRPNGKIVLTRTKNVFKYLHQLNADGSTDTTFGGGLGFVFKQNEHLVIL